MNFSEKLKLLRKERGWNQEEASKKIGIALSSLRKYEQVGKPDIPQLIKIKECFNVSYDYLLNDKCNTRSISNLEIVNNLGITEQTINSIKTINNKEFLEDLFTNNYSKDLFSFLEEQANLKYVNDYLLNKFCKRIYKTKNYNSITEITINTMQYLIEFMEKDKIKQNYWNFITDNSYYKDFMASIKYIIFCWNNEQEIKSDDERLKYFNDNTFIEISKCLDDYESYCYANFSNILNKFCNSYEENMIFKI